jgi:molybdate transport system ATP-binding protein
VLRVELETVLGALHLDVALDVAPGRTLALAGPSGAGKTTVLRTVAGLLTPAGGYVACGGETWLDTERRVRLAPEDRRCGYVPQQHALFPHLSARDNVAYGIRGSGRRERRRRAGELLERFGLEARAGARPADLSGGERQRVALARALAARPRALLLDEPLAALDARTRASASRALSSAMRDAGVPALLVTHDFAEAAALGDEVAVLDAGRVRQRGSPADLAARPASPFVADFTGACVLDGEAAPGPGGLTAVRVGRAVVFSTDQAIGPVAASVFPWEIELLEPSPGAPGGSAQNRLPARVTAVTPLGNRVRVALAAGEGGGALAAEVTAAAAARLGLDPGRAVVASWKATATRLAPR